MGLPTLSRRELANAVLSFTPIGDTVDSVIVAAELWPDEIPTTNFTDYNIPDIEKIVEEKNMVDEEIMIPNAGGGYFADDEQMVTARKWVATTSKTNSYIKQLDKGLAAVAVGGAAQAHGTKSDNYLMGILKITETGKNGSVIETTKVWAKMRVRSTGETGPATKKIEIEFKQYYSSLNTVTVAA